MPTKSPSPPPQIHDGLDSTGSPFKKCFRVLQKICSSRMILPTTYEVSGVLSFSATEVMAYGGFCDVYKGSLGVSDVCIKRLRISLTGDRTKVKQVLHPCSLRLHRHILTTFAGTLQGGCDVETHQSPKYRALHWCHLRAPPTRVRMGNRWRVEGIYQE